MTHYKILKLKIISRKKKILFKFNFKKKNLINLMTKDNLLKFYIIYILTIKSNLIILKRS